VLFEHRWFAAATTPRRTARRLFLIRAKNRCAGHGGTFAHCITTSETPLLSTARCALFATTLQAWCLLSPHYNAIRGQAPPTTYAATAFTTTVPRSLDVRPLPTIFPLSGTPRMATPTSPRHRHHRRTGLVRLSGDARPATHIRAGAVCHYSYARVCYRFCTLRCTWAGTSRRAFRLALACHILFGTPWTSIYRTARAPLNARTPAVKTYPKQTSPFPQILQHPSLRALDLL